MVTEQNASAEALYQVAHAAMGQRNAPAAIAALQGAVASGDCTAKHWRLYGFALREEQRMREAIAAFERANQLDPSDSLTVAALGQTRVQCGLPAVDWLRRAMHLSPQNKGLVLSLASALLAEGNSQQARELLDSHLQVDPAWLEGHQKLAEIRWTGGDTEHFADSYARAVAMHPTDIRLRLAWFRFLSQAKQWDAARQVLKDAERAVGEQKVLLIARTFLAAESCSFSEAEHLFEQTQGLHDEVRELAWIRHCLRLGRPAEAEATAMRLTRTPSANLVWPYLSLIWRMLNSARAEWLDGSPPYIKTFDIDLSRAQMEELAELLRSLHLARAPYIEQSVRGGTQTERPLFFRTEPIIEQVQRQLTAAVRDYIRQLPAFEAGHPLLGTPRSHLLYSGSWSVRLQRQGYNVAHTHPLGWLSSAFYVSLPTSAQMGDPPAGWIRFGEPPAELRLDLRAYSQIQPAVGRLVIFPSTMWHSTVPFDDGERLVLAFDVRTPSM